MDLTMVEFNAQFKKYMNDVKILEKTHPRESIGLWVQICQFIVNFAKSPQCPRTLRPKLVNQADSIIVKVKHMQQGHINSVFSKDAQVPQEHISSSVAQHTNSFSSEENLDDLDPNSEDHLLSQLNSLPEIPSDEIADQSTKSNISNDQNPQDPTQNSNELTPPPSNATTMEPTNKSETIPPKFDSSPLYDLKKLEEELKQMPSNMTEISPSPYANQSIIPDVDKVKKNLDLDSYKKETTFLDVTNTVHQGDGDQSEVPDQSKNARNDIMRVAGFSKDPLDRDKSKPEIINDPFSSVDPDENLLDQPEQRTCFACGGSLDDKVLKCPLCGTENPLN
ncbi:hypothetical protein [Candidatus Lokiarchaeum ossiferum]|uniref:hypothetical protein n=1 Tax=Candidatus Lokiarchaeum ossiferum TaxID=2951803 RepID=UPI00352E48AD